MCVQDDISFEAYAASHIIEPLMPLHLGFSPISVRRAFWSEVGKQLLALDIPMVCLQIEHVKHYVPLDVNVTWGDIIAHLAELLGLSLTMLAQFHAMILRILKYDIKMCHCRRQT